MLQNRVDPFGRIIATTARGSWMGNRGVIHNEQKEIVASHKHKAWIICKLEFKGRVRKVMTPGRWTELFFLDEATALAAGHRPCFECRREDANRFKTFWIQGNPSHHFNMKTSIREIDGILHKERTEPKKRTVAFQDIVSRCATGTFVSLNENAFLVSHGQLHLWTPSGYEKNASIFPDSVFSILTPPSIVNAIRAGYVPHLRFPQ